MNYYGQSQATGGGSVDPVDKILYERYFYKKTDGVAVECGANDGIFVSSCLAFEEIGWKVYNIEASIANFNKLILNRPKSHNFFFALSNVDNQVVQIYNYYGDNGGQNSLVNYPEVGNRLGLTGTSEVNTVRYDTLFAGIKIDLLVLDVEGHEVEALQGIDFDNNNCPLVICVEHNRCGLELLKNVLHKYNLDYVDDLNAYFIKGLNFYNTASKK